jgi:hypothetical protein
VCFGPLRDARNFLAVFTLEPEVIKWLTHFAPTQHDHKVWVCPFRRHVAKPYGTATLKPAITDDRETADLGKELN